MTISRPIHVAVNGIIYFVIIILLFFMAELYFIMCVCVKIYTHHSSVNGHLGQFFKFCKIELKYSKTQTCKTYMISQTVKH